MSRVHNNEDREAWIGIQRKTFTRWANQYLPPGNKIEELVPDLADGTVLASLLGRISDENVGRINSKPKMDIQKLENLNQCLKFIRDHDIPLVNIGSSDILKGNEKLVLGLLWTIILRFEVSGADGKAGLLLWLQRSTKGYTNVDVKDFTSSWTDGLAFNALIHRYRPDLLEFDGLSPAEGLANCEQAFSIAEDKLGIARLLDPEDVVEHPDEKSQVAYLSQFFKLFAGQAKLESKLRAVKNAVAVTRRHDDWMNQYTQLSKEVQDFVSSNKSRFENAPALSATDDVKAALDDFNTYMNNVKPEMASKRAEAEGVYTTLVSSKRNNNRPEFSAEIPPADLGAAWESLEHAEQSYERQMLDRYLSYRMADHAVAKFKAKSVAVNVWLDEKLAVFGEGVKGGSVSELETELEMHASYESRLKLYDTVMEELRAIVAKAETSEGHAGVADASQGMRDLDEKMSTCKSQGESHRSALESALESEKALAAKDKLYLQKINELDFLVDQLDQSLSEDITGATTAEMTELQGQMGSIEQSVQAALTSVDEVSALAAEIESKRPDAKDHCAQQRSRIESMQSKVNSLQSDLGSVLAAEQRRDELSQRFAGLANEFASFCDGQRAALGGVSGSLDDQKEAIAKLRSEVAGEDSAGAAKLAALEEASQACEEAELVANTYTTHTIFSLRSNHEQLLKDLKRADEAISAQLMAQKSLQISPEQLKEAQEIFSVFDTDNDGKLRLSELREACLGAGIDLDDQELESRMRARSSTMVFTQDDFIAFFVDELQSGDSKDDVVEAFKAIAPEGSLSSEQIQKNFGAIDADLASYLQGNMSDGDYVKFTEQLFTR
ncbi:Alpha-actinin-1 [Hondaea fermentalgiana]|uniref:Alpha-actinin-1 n=1 Tax=Hondaea fermentalgiana TaxID=2315210 RepID=A0A2R5G6D2_9STRA|nr:Alpha-actinin-1 [Hondaea fermentalgiana]|eukprot:GBG26612.1 Alpha-actinin-1 [Hondaea fermentalgiana]